MRIAGTVLLASAAVALLVAGTTPASASGTKPYGDKKRGFRLHLGDKFEQVPPKLTADEAYIVGDWYADAAKFDGGFQRPEFKVFWFATPKAGTVTPGAHDKDKPAAPPPAAASVMQSVDDA